MQFRAELLNDLANFCAVGTVEMVMPRRESKGLQAPDGWAWLEPPATKRPMFSGNSIEAWGEALLRADILRATYKMLDNKRARVRIYLLPEDVGGSTGLKRDRLKGVIANVLKVVNVNRRSWEGECWIFEPLAKLDDNTCSLFYMFNTLKSPDIQPADIQDENVRDLIVKVLVWDIPGIKTTLYNYQRRSVAQMLEREMLPRSTIDSRVQEIRSPTGDRYYLDPVKPALYKTPTYYEDVRGGILAEDMGLGKTLICLAMIAATKYQTSEIPEEHRLYTQSYESAPSLLNLCVSAIWKHSLPWGRYERSLSETCMEAIRSNRAYYTVQQGSKSTRAQHLIEKKKIYIGTGTLVVVPPNLVDQWKSEITKHVKPGYLNVLELISLQSVIPPVNELLKYDVILISRSRLNKEEAEGKDNLGRREFNGVPLVCACPYVGSTRTRLCTCVKRVRIYRSPLNSIRWKRIIVDEGHSMAGGSKTTTVMVADKLHVDRRWIVSGTPTSGLMSAMPGMGDYDINSVGDESIINLSTKELRQRALELKRESQMKESNDLERLGRIVVDFLKMPPWAGDSRRSSWHTYIKNGFADRRAGAVTCVRNILQRLMVRHLPEDVEEDVVLPPLYHKPVFIQPGYFEKLTMNLFLGALAANAVTSEREDEDYMFHPSQRGSLRILIGNLTKESGFFWSKQSREDVKELVQICKKYLEDPSTSSIYSTEDYELLRKTIRAGEMAIACEDWNTFSFYQQMGYFLINVPSEIEKSWAFASNDTSNDDTAKQTLFGGTALVEMKQHVYLQFGDVKTICKNGQEYMTACYISRCEEQKKQRRKRDQKDQSSKRIPGSVSGADSHATTLFRNMASTSSSLSLPGTQAQASHRKTSSPKKAKPQAASKKPILKEGRRQDKSIIPPDSPLADVQIVGTASKKLTYLLEQILLYHKNEKILVFFEADDVALYISEALEILGIEVLLYLKSAKVETRAQYIVTFQELERFRVLLMDVSQAAHGLNVSRATRVYFVNPIWQPAIEAQALKRAHRIGQTKPVYAETLVLAGTIEEAMLRRRWKMSEKELNESKTSIVDDNEMRALIQRLDFLDVDDGEESTGWRKVALLKTPKSVFNNADVFGFDNENEGRDDVGEDGLIRLPGGRNSLVVDRESKEKRKGKGKEVQVIERKRKVAVRFLDQEVENENEDEVNSMEMDVDDIARHRNSRGRKAVRFG